MWGCPFASVSLLPAEHDALSNYLGQGFSPSNGSISTISVPWMKSRKTSPSTVPFVNVYTNIPSVDITYCRYVPHDAKICCKLVVHSWGCIQIYGYCPCCHCLSSIQTSWFTPKNCTTAINLPLCSTDLCLATCLIFFRMSANGSTNCRWWDEDPCYLWDHLTHLTQVQSRIVKQQPNDYKLLLGA